MGGGGGASPQIPELNTRDVQPWYNFQGQQFGQYVQNQPLLNAAQGNALSYNQSLPSTLSGLGTAQQYYQNIVNSGGQASAQELRNVDQGTLTGMSDTHSLGAQGTELLNRDQYTQQRMANATGQLQGLGSSIQGLQSGGLNQLTGVQGAETGTFTQLMNPILQIPLANEQARIAQAQIMEQSQQAASSKSAGGIGAIGQVLGSVIGAVAMSDEKLKEKIKDTGLKTMSGIPLKTFHYKGDKRKYLGAMAQDVEKVHPDAVREDLLTGFKFIDLSKTDVPMAQVA